MNQKLYQHITYQENCVKTSIFIWKSSPRKTNVINNFGRDKVPYWQGRQSNRIDSSVRSVKKYLISKHHLTTAMLKWVLKHFHFNLSHSESHKTFGECFYTWKSKFQRFEEIVNIDAAPINLGTLSISIKGKRFNMLPGPFHEEPLQLR